MTPDRLAPPREVLEYYEQFPEESRLASGPFKLEFERTKDMLTRFLPPAPARVIDVGGAAGAYSTWLTGLGYDVHLIDATPRLVTKARERNATLTRRSEEHTSELQSHVNLVCRLLLEKKKINVNTRLRYRVSKKVNSFRNISPTKTITVHISYLIFSSVGSIIFLTK